MSQIQTAVLSHSAPLSPNTREELRKLLALSGPIVLLMVMRMAMGFVDFAMVSALGTSAQAAVSPASFLVFNILAIGMGATTSAQTYAAQCLGRGEKREAAAYGWQVVYIGVVFLLLSLPMSLAARPFWTAIGAPPDVLAGQIAYTQVAFWCMGFGLVAFGLEGFFNGVHRPSVAIVSAVVALIVNIFANYALIFGRFGFPELGIRGAAYATVLAWAVRAAICIGVMLSREFRTEYDSLQAWRIDFRRIRRMITIGWPVSLQWTLDIGAWFVFLSVIMKAYGENAMAASNTGFQVLHLSFMPALGVAVAVSSMIGHAIGEGRPHLAHRRAKLALVVIVGYMSLMALLFYFGRHELIQIFNDDPAVVAFGAAVMVWAAIFQLFDGMGMLYSNALRGAGDTRWPAIAVAVCCWTIFIGGGLVVTRLRPDWGINGPWLMATVYIATIGLVLWRRFAGGAWLQIDLFKDQPAAAREMATIEAGMDVPPVLAALQPGAELHQSAMTTETTSAAPPEKGFGVEALR